MQPSSQKKTQGKRSEFMTDNEHKAGSFQQIYQQFMPRMVHFALKFVHQEEAEDIVQDVFISFWDKDLEALSEEEVSRLLFASVRNRCIDRLRRLQNEQLYLERQATQLRIEELDYYDNSDTRFMQKDMMSQIEKHIAQLPEKSQRIFHMAYNEGLRAAEIAEKLSLSVRTVENMLYRSLQHLRKRCSDLISILLYLTLIK